MTDVTLPSGIAKDELDADVRPQDDLFRHVNGKWIDRTEIPADKARYGSFLRARRGGRGGRARRSSRRRSRPSRAPRRARSATSTRASWTSSASTSSARRRSPASSSTSALIDSIDAFLATLGRLERQGVGGLPAALRRQRPGRPRALPRLRRAGRHRPARRELLPRGEVRRRSATAYRRPPRADVRPRRARRRRRPRGRASSTSRPRSRRCTGTTCDTRDSEKTYNPIELGGCARARRRSVDLRRLARRLGRARGRVRRARACASRSFVEGLGALLTEERLAAWRDWLAWQVIRSTAPYLLERLRRGELRLLRPHPHRHPADARALEARRLARRGRDGRGRRHASTSSGTSRPAAKDGDGRARRATSSRRTGSRSPTLDWMGDEDPRARPRQARASSRRRSATR